MADKENVGEGWSEGHSHSEGWGESKPDDIEKLPDDHEQVTITSISHGFSESVTETNEKGDTITRSKGWGVGRSVTKQKGDEKNPE